MPRSDIHQWLAWPEPSQVFAPRGAGARVYADFVSQKIGGDLKQAHKNLDVKVGVLLLDPASNSTTNPLAVVCEFSKAAPPGALARVQQLAWCFSRTAMVVTIEPHLFRAESCWLDPTKPESERLLCSMPLDGKFKTDGSPEQRRVRDLLHMVNLVTSRWQQLHPAKFPAEGRAEVHLLKTMRHVRRELINGTDARPKLPERHCHDLLARLIFTQFLFDRKDSKGLPFFSPNLLKRLREEGVLSAARASLADILASKVDTYSLFRWMDSRFNGDLFPGKQTDDSDVREAAWITEYEAVSVEHLNLLAELVRGNLELDSHQRSLWRHYSFDTIPLEFISSIYEEFLTAAERQQDKAYYTPSHLVDYVLDAVLPWNSKKWENVRILDPCCGSGIFLVKSFQRLIHRWRLANPKRKPLVSDLRPILEKQLTGVDRNEEAVRVASFSLYLAMADAIEPRHYMTRGDDKVFPPLTGKSLLCSDFFDEETPGIRTGEDAGSYDFVLGNAPWGDGSSRIERLPNEPKKDYDKRTAANHTKAELWALKHDWRIANNDIGPLFLSKAAPLLRENGYVAMVNNANMLYRRDQPACEQRRKFFTSFTFDKITNLAALRRELFAEALGPACIVVFSSQEPDPSSVIHYLTPKPLRPEAGQKTSGYKDSRFIVEPQDIKTFTHNEATEDPIIWSVLALGGPRDLQLIRRLAAFPTVESLRKEGKLLRREGVIFGKGGQAFDDPNLVNLPLLASPSLPCNGYELDAGKLPVWDNPCGDADASNNFEAFKNPQLIVKQTLTAATQRFRAVIVRASRPNWGAICSQAYLSIRDLEPDGRHIRPACIVYNSLLAAYYVSLTSSRVGHYITEALAGELTSIPLPPPDASVSFPSTLKGSDNAVRKMFSLTEADWLLIEDLLEFSLPDALRKTPGAARKNTLRITSKGVAEPDLTAYTQTFLRVFQATFGKGLGIAATILTEPSSTQDQQPLRMVTLHIGSSRTPAIEIEPAEADHLLEQLGQLHRQAIDKKPGISGFQRVAYLFDRTEEDGITVMHLHIIKPDECRYWTRTAALRDADRLAGEIMLATRPPVSK
jgi:N-6 DNA Methylase